MSQTKVVDDQGFPKPEEELDELTEQEAEKHQDDYAKSSIAFIGLALLVPPAFPFFALCFIISAFASGSFMTKAQEAREYKEHRRIIMENEKE